MAVVFTVEDGTGLPGANSYASLEEADDILITNPHVWAAWNALKVPLDPGPGDDRTAQEYLLIWGSRVLDYRVDWYGNLAVPGSGLRWPRTGVLDRDGNPIPSDVVPRAVKEATVEMARTLLVGDRTTDRDQDGLERIKVDVIELVFREGYKLPTIPSDVVMILKGLGDVTSGSTGFAKIIRA